MMTRPVRDVRIRLWGRDVAAASWDEAREIGVFQYAPDFVRSHIEIAPLTMPLRAAPYSFPALPRASFHGLPGLLADCLPDKFGHALIDAWLARQGRPAASFSPVERLCYIGRRAMGALEFEPSEGPDPRRGGPVEIDALRQLAETVLLERKGLSGALDPEGDTSDTASDADALGDILRVGTSAGGARAKALLAWNPKTGAFRSGQVEAGDGFEYWLLKFDGVADNRDKELADPQGFGLIEYAYHLMARAAGIEMTECRIHAEGDRRHFMTRRFDRTPTGGKIHQLSLAGMAHFDFNAAGAHGYEQVFDVLRRLDAPYPDFEQQVRRAIFNVLARNQDDHVKNVAFLMDKAGRWRLSPAYDVTYAWNPSGAWTSRHQMSLNGKRDGFERDDLMDFARAGGVKTRRAAAIIDEIAAAVGRWTEFAEKAGVAGVDADRIARAHRRLV